MGFVNRVDHARRQMFATAEGAITLSDIQAHLHVERREGGLGYAELIDARHATVAFSSADVRTVAAWLGVFAREHALGPTAIVVSTPEAYGTMRMLDLLVEGFCAVRPFYDTEKAEEWLGAGGTAVTIPPAGTPDARSLAVATSVARHRP